MGQAQDYVKLSRTVEKKKPYQMRPVNMECVRTGFLSDFVSPMFKFTLHNSWGDLTIHSHQCRSCKNIRRLGRVCNKSPTSQELLNVPGFIPVLKQGLCPKAAILHTLNLTSCLVAWNLKSKVTRPVCPQCWSFGVWFPDMFYKNAVFTSLGKNQKKHSQSVKALLQVSWFGLREQNNK